MEEDIRGLAHRGALADHRGVRYRSAVVRVTDNRWARQDIGIDSAGPRQYPKIVQVDMDGGHLGTEKRQMRYSGESSPDQVEIAGLVECWCQNVLARRHEDWDRRGQADFYYRAGQHRKVMEGEGVAVAVGTWEEVVAE